jgi:hypothetical protein
MNKKVMSLQFEGIQVTIEGDGGSIVSALKTAEHNESDKLYNSAMDGIESLILSLALQGYDVRSPKFVKAVKDTVSACANNI